MHRASSGNTRYANICYNAAGKILAHCKCYRFKWKKYVSISIQIYRLNFEVFAFSKIGKNKQYLAKLTKKYQ